jgi:branched-chain amino acid transport system substrate-binding protein
LPAQGNSSKEIDKLFEIALANYEAKQFNTALVNFNRIITDFSYNSKTTVSEFFKAKIFLEQNQLSDFKKTADGFVEKYPNSRYIDEIRMMLIEYYLEVANYYNSFKEALNLIDKTESEEYLLEAKKTGEGIAAKYLIEDQLQRLNSSFTNRKVRSYLLLQIAKDLIRNGNSEGAKNVLSEIINNYSDLEEYDEAERLYDVPYNILPSGKIIGVMLPLEINETGKYTSEPASEILEGIKFAVNEYNSTKTEKIGLLIRDTNKDVSAIGDIKDEFTSLSSLVAVLGPIYSNEVREALDQFYDYNIPIISPTATDDDLTDLSQNFFQANPSFSMRGRVMAQYIFYVENKRTVSILNSIDGYSPLLATSFAEEFENLSGKILKRESFSNDSTNFDEQLSRIYADSLTLEGIYIPLSDNSITPFLLSGMTKYKMQIPVYGNQDWFTAKGFETAPEISNNLVFESDYFIDFASEEYQNFNTQFVSLSGKEVNRNVFYGYDAAKFLLTAIRNSEGGREGLRAKMISGMTSSGLHNNVSFDERRINKFLNIVRYQDGVFQLIDKFRLSK